MTSLVCSFFFYSRGGGGGGGWGGGEHSLGAGEQRGRRLGFV